MAHTTYRNRKAVQIENEQLQLTVLVEGGHIAEIRHKGTGVNPLWTPPWPSIEPSAYDPQKHPEYGQNAESKLLAGIMGHNLCLDLFGPPSDEEAAAGMTVHGEASILPYRIEPAGACLTACVELPTPQLLLERRIELAGDVVLIAETVENLSRADRPIAWTQHVTLGPPFIEPGSTQFRASVTQSRVYETDFAGGKGYMKPGADFQWPHVPHKDGGTVDLRVYPDYAVSGGYTAHLMDLNRDHSFFTAWSPSSRLLFGYVWKRNDFPWLGIWEENRSRDSAPWNGCTITRGMEFGVSPMPETRRQMIERGSLFGVPAFRWIPARTRVTASYCAFLRSAQAIPEEVVWDGAFQVTTP